VENREAPSLKGFGKADDQVLFPWKTLALYCGLTMVLFAPVLYRMGREWFTEEEMGHGIFVPFLVGYIIWKQRETLLSLPVRPSWWGVPLIAWGFIQLLLGELGADYFVARTAFLFSLVGIVWTVCGTAILKELAFPLFLLAFMIRLPLFVYSQITFPLQIFASQAAEFSLSLIGIPVLRDGNVLELADQRLNVVEACSGIRSLISLSFLALVYAYFFDNKGWMRIVLLVATIPIAIIANASRVTLTGIISEYKKEFAEGAYHTFEGWVIFMVALTAMIIVHQLINRAYSLFNRRKAA
jgi:exosortase